ncbi:MAG: hypothetical protein AAFU79_15085, partial [Myxococcota bacterium]
REISRLIEARIAEAEAGGEVPFEVPSGLEVIEAVLYGRAPPPTIDEAVTLRARPPVRPPPLPRPDSDTTEIVVIAPVEWTGEIEAPMTRRDENGPAAMPRTPYNDEGPATRELPIEEPVEAEPRTGAPEPEAVAAVPRNLAYRALAAPVRLDPDGHLVCLVAEDERAPERVEELSGALGWPVVAVAAPHGDILASLAAAYGPIDGVDQDALLVALVEHHSGRRQGLMARMSSWFANT